MARAKKISKKPEKLPKAERRQQILTVARDVFARRGYHQSTIDDIVAEAGVARGTFYLYFEDKPTDMDEQFESHGIALFIDPLSYQYLDGTEIDFVEGVHGAGFKFGNPNVAGTCGCGSSFSV